MQGRAYSILTVKAVGEDERVITGTATTPEPDRIGDVVEPLGVQFRNPMPLLHQHDHHSPVGTVTFDKPTAKGVTFTARMPKIDEPGPLKDRVDTAWGEVKAGLVRAVSIGFRALEDGYEVMKTGGIRYLATEVMELSLVTIPANAGATITAIKAIDTAQRAASGPSAADVRRSHTPGATGPINIASPQRRGGDITMPNNVSEQILALEQKRAANAAAMHDIMQKSMAEGRTTDASEQEQFDALQVENDKIDGDLKRFRALEKSLVSTARTVSTETAEKAGADGRQPAFGHNSGATITVKEPKVEPGVQFARLARVKALAHLDHESPRAIAKALYGENSPVYRIVTKANVVAGASVTGNWAEDLVGDETSVFGDFAEFLRPMTIVGKFGTGNIPSLRRIPFRTPLIGQTGGGQAYWVGEGKPKPLTAFDFNRTNLDELKVATISVVTEELLRKSSPSADVILRDSLAAAVAERIDIDFVNPAKAAVAGVSPASITNGVAAIASSGNDAESIREDLAALWAPFIAARNPPRQAVYIMDSMTALRVGMMKNALGQTEFPGLTLNGGLLDGVPVIVSDYLAAVSAGGFVVLVNASDIYFADEGGVQVDVSREASLQMLDNPTNDVVTPTATSMVSMWQTNSVAYRAERILNWSKRRASAVSMLDEVNWGQPTP